MKGHPWTPEQDAVLWDRAGMVPPAEVARLVSEVGPPRTLSGIYFRAAQLEISLKKRQRRRFRREVWLPEEDAMLLELAGRVLVNEIMRRLNERFRSRRRVSGVQMRMSKLGASAVVPDLLTLREIASILCVNASEVKRLLQAGELACERQSTGVRSAWRVRPAALEAYMREYPERLNVRLMSRSRWRDLALVIARRSPYLSLPDTARRLGIGNATLGRLIRDGEVPGAVQYPTHFWRVPLSAVAMLQPLVATLKGRRVTETRALALLTGEWQAGEQIAARLDCDVRAIRAALLRARARGVPVEGKAGSGYRLVASLERAS